MNTFQHFTNTKHLLQLSRSRLNKGYIFGRAQIQFWSSRIECKEVVISFWESMKFLVVRSDWIGDSDSGISCHKFEIDVTEQPKSLPYSLIKKGDRKIRKLDHVEMSVDFFEANTEIREIRVYQYEGKSNSEDIKYDKGLAIFSENNLPLVIQSVWGIQGGIYLECSNECLKELEEEAKLRESIIF